MAMRVGHQKSRLDSLSLHVLHAPHSLSLHDVTRRRDGAQHRAVDAGAEEQY